MNKIAINTLGDELEKSADYCRSKGLGIEYTDFAFPWILNGDIGDRINRHSETIAGISPLISHGPFFDLVTTSPDSAITTVARQRHDMALTATAKIGASFYIAHTNFNPLIRDPSYRKKWKARMLDFWLPLADDAGKANIVICLENVWEPVPDIQAELIASGNHPHLQASFDNGHVLVFSDVPSSDWIKTLGSMITHCHFHDNNGELDQHKPIGEGIENWDALTSAIKEHSPQAILVMESDSLYNNKLSIGRLKEFWDIKKGIR
ncbi:MAG: sugar phosphate isomerase/epimerase [Candidatus Zixiibacteriota bacterium]|nr:MAG: sugar phosphate isomerase/epimerase [candidate division Zixibacteria bacterium]